MHSAPNFHSGQSNYAPVQSDMRISTEKARPRGYGEKSRYQQEHAEWEDHDPNKHVDEEHFYFQSVPNSHENSAVKDSARGPLGKVSSPQNDSDPRKSKGSTRSMSGESYSKMNAAKKSAGLKGSFHLHPQQEKNIKPVSPGRTTGGKMTPNASVTRFSTAGMSVHPDPTSLDSEFSYTKGQAFSKSQRKLHDHIQDIPGPGYYKPEDGMQKVKAKSPTSVIGKSPKVTIFERVHSDSPGHIYYPTHHFITKG